MKTHRKQTSSEHKHSIKALEERLASFRLPSGSFDYAIRGAAVTEAHDLYTTAFQLRMRNPHESHLYELHRRAVELWHQAIDAAYPPGFWEDYERLRQGDRTGVETAIGFLEADPMFFRSGYVKATLIRRLKPGMLTAGDAARLRRVVLHVVDTRYDRDFRAFCRLARKVDDAGLRRELAQRLSASDADVRRRAGWMLAVL